MKLYIAVLCIVLIQGVHVNCQSSLLDSAMSTLNSAYQQYRNGSLLRDLFQIAKEYINSAIGRLNQLQNFISKLQLPQLASVPQLPVQNIPKIWQQWRGR